MEDSKKRIGVVVMALGLLGGSASSATAQMQYVQSRPVQGSYAWHQDGWYYRQQGGQWLRTNYRRVFPNPANPHVYDVYDNGRFLKRIDTSQPGWVKELPAANLAASSAVSWTARPVNIAVTEANTWLLLKATNRWTTAARMRAARAPFQVPAGGGVQTGLYSGTLGGVSGAVITQGNGGAPTGGLYSSVLGGVPGPVITHENSSGINVTAEASKLGGYTYGPIR